MLKLPAASSSAPPPRPRSRPRSRCPRSRARPPESTWRWDKAPCRFSGVGCGVLGATAKGKVVAVKGDPESPVNRGLLCAKGLSLPHVHAATDRLTTPLLRKEGGRFDKRVPLASDGEGEAHRADRRRGRETARPIDR